MGARHSRRRPSNSVGGHCSLDTVTLARQEREAQGTTWEAEVSYGGEADLHRHLEACDKNPGHQNFIPVDQFNVEHLLSGYHDNDLVDYVRAVSDLTVRVSVTYVSENRPEAVPGSDKPYPCYSNRGRDMMRVGTGLIDDVRKFTDKYLSDTTCECKECLNSATPTTQFACICIRTAAHVVYDQLEGAHTTCHLFFDRGGTPALCSGVVTLSGMSDVWSNTDRDFCNMYYYTHDMDLVDRLQKMYDNRRFIASKVYSNLKGKFCNNNYVKLHPLSYTGYNPYQLRQIPIENDLNKILTIIVSHPHGCSKQVSLGYCTGIQRRGGGQVRYTTATCPGSSGAQVCLLGATDDCTDQAYNHSGNCESNTELNFCRLRF